MIKILEGFAGELSSDNIVLPLTLKFEQNEKVTVKFIHFTSWFNCSKRKYNFSSCFSEMEQFFRFTMNGSVVVSYKHPNNIFDDLNGQSVVPKSLLGKAINYTLNQWNRLVVYLEYPFMTPDNNLAENTIRPFCVGRKSLLFAGNPEGAAASAAIYSLIETAKANNLEPYKYLRYLFEKTPFANCEDDWRALLPTNLKPEQLALSEFPTGV